MLALLQPPEQLVSPGRLGPLHPRLRLLPALPSHCHAVPREQENPAGHLQRLHARSDERQSRKEEFQRDRNASFPCSTVLASLKSVHETLSQERQKLQEAWEANNTHQSAEVSPSSGISGTASLLEFWNSTAHIVSAPPSSSSSSSHQA